MTLTDVLMNDGKLCACGRKHYALLKKAVIEDGAINKIPDIVKGEGAESVFMLCDLNTYGSAGEKVERLLTDAGITVKKYVFPTDEIIEPDEKAVGSAVMHYENADMIIGVGSGVINDLGKTVDVIADKTYMIVGTAPSMDGYASGTVSMVRDGHKTTIKTKCPEIIIGDLDVLSEAPIDMLRAGVGDILAKYISICEWRIGTVVKDEAYCEAAANMVKEALHQVVSNAEKLMKRDHTVVKAVMEGLILSGIAINYAESTRVVSGAEHYYSHLWDMRGLEFGTPVHLHGIQCGTATIEVMRAYEILKRITPDREKALSYVKNFDVDSYNEKLRAFVGHGSEPMIELEKKEKKYTVPEHTARLDKIINGWDKIIAIINEEIPLDKALEAINVIGAPSSGEQLGKTSEIMAKSFVFSKDIRDKYVVSRLAFDLGVIDEIALELYGTTV